MRQWNVDPWLMCNQHIIGEHYECHMFAGTINLGRSVQGYLEKGLLEVRTLHERHDDLENEMRHRRMRPNSPLKAFLVSDVTTREMVGNINVKENLKELYRRCGGCREKQDQFTAIKLHEFITFYTPQGWVVPIHNAAHVPNPLASEIPLLRNKEYDKLRDQVFGPRYIREAVEKFFEENDA